MREMTARLRICQPWLSPTQVGQLVGCEALRVITTYNISANVVIIIIIIHLDFVLKKYCVKLLLNCFTYIGFALLMSRMRSSKAGTHPRELQDAEILSAFAGSD